ncbi:hypothetical protein KEM55_006581 [Ascosphaera atra]|nr:hypothetical protein KEM55_006581 [Ascosphaera atra]
MEDNAELESFRQKWREEVSSRRKPNKANDARPQAREQARRTDAAQREHEFTAHAAPVQLPPEVIAAKEDQTNQPGLAPLHDKFHALNLREEDPSDAFAAKEPAKPPESALEHFEQAAKKEAQGNLGSSLDLYRKAYKTLSAFIQHYEVTFAKV